MITSLLFKFLPLAFLLLVAQINCIEYKTFPDGIDSDFIRTNSYVALGAIQVTPDVTGATMADRSGRALYKKPFKLWRGGVRASLNSTFVLNISPSTNPGGEGLAFILTANTSLPEKSQGQWLGIVNENTNGSAQAQIVAIEFDTRKSYTEDIDSNHVGLDVNSVYSIKQVSMGSYGINISNGSDVTVNVRYDGGKQNLTVFISTNGEIGDSPVLSEIIDLSIYLPENVHVGFSASTSNYTQLNCVKSWEFHVSDIKNRSKMLWVWITTPVLTLTLITGIVIGLYFRRKSKSEEDAYPSIEDQIKTSSLAPQRFKLRELKDATGGFSRQNKLGKGGFGPVYKGTWKNKEIAVKKVSKKSSQGKTEFIAEVTTIGNLNHRNLVKLIGWCYEKPEYLLVYEYMPKGSLDKYLFSTEESTTIGWEKRLNIVTGLAHALDYLHDGCDKRVLHRDVKASNIMLDSDFTPKLGDFGLARMVDQTEKTHHSTKEIAGTPGYMAPESFLVGRATMEMDIYAFGVLVLEVACGRKNGGFNGVQKSKSSVVDWVWELYRCDQVLDAADQRLEGSFVEEEMASVMLLGLACCHPNPHRRPSMKNVLQVLTGEVRAPLVPAEKPSFVWPAMPPSFKESDDSIPGGQVSTFTELSGR
jgi:hypothetical protein